MYLLSPCAAADLEAILEYTLEQWGEEQFEHYLGMMKAALEAVAASPMLPGSKARDDLLSGCRFYRVEHHYLAYRVAGDDVEVGRILQERMNFEMQISGEDFEE